MGFLLQKYSKVLEKLLHLDNVYLIENVNPLNIFYTFKKFRKKLFFITPQYHGFLTAYLNNIEQIPLYYSHKGKDLLNSLGIKGFDISNGNFDNFFNKYIK